MLSVPLGTRSKLTIFIKLNLKNISTHALCPRLLSADSVVLDLGANTGEFSRQITADFHCAVHAVEASPLMYAALPENPLITNHQVAICSTDGPVLLHISSNPEATSLQRLKGFSYSEQVEVCGRKLTTFVSEQRILRIDLLKLDIEGAEIGVLKSLPSEFLNSIDQVSVEFHEWLGGSTKEEVEFIISKIKKIGFHFFSLVRGNYSNVLFVNKRRMNSIQYWSTLLFHWVPRILCFLIRVIKDRLLKGAIRVR